MKSLSELQSIFHQAFNTKPGKIISFLTIAKFSSQTTTACTWYRKGNRTMKRGSAAGRRTWTSYGFFLQEIGQRTTNWDRTEHNIHEEQQQQQQDKNTEMGMTFPSYPGRLKPGSTILNAISLARCWSLKGTDRDSESIKRFTDYHCYYILIISNR